MREGKEINIDSKENEKYKKVIFLDIDGVLTTNQEYDLVVDEQMVQRLKKIIDATGADVIMSSSRRATYLRYKHHPEALDEYDTNEMKQLQVMFDKYGIEIAGVTSNLEQGRGYRTRPCQIKDWLVDKPKVSNFVILDDDPWEWGWLMDYVVRTKRPHPTREYGDLYGLQDEDVQKGIEILNEERENYLS